MKPVCDEMYDFLFDEYREEFWNAWNEFSYLSLQDRLQILRNHNFVNQLDNDNSFRVL